MTITGHTLIGTYWVNVNYGLSLSEMIAGGSFDTVDRRIIKWFQTAAGNTGGVTLQTIKFTADRRYDGAEAGQAMKRLGYRSANLAELIAFGASVPREPGAHYVALGTSGWGTLTRVHVAEIYITLQAVTKELRALAWSDLPGSGEHFVVVQK